MPVGLRVTGRENVISASRRIREHANPREVRKELNRALKEAAIPTADEVRQAALDLPAKSNKRILRQRIASAVSVQVKSGGKNPSVKIRVSRARMRDKAPVPQLMDRGPFRHPVFGREKWAKQEGHKQWFEKVIQKKAPEVRKRIKEAADRIEHEISHH
jgi:hypothetical protein